VCQRRILKVTALNKDRLCCATHDTQHPDCISLHAEGVSSAYAPTYAQGTRKSSTMHDRLHYSLQVCIDLIPCP
jgi:hypothetical protein